MSNQPDNSESEETRLRLHREKRGKKKRNLSALLKEYPSSSDALGYFSVIKGESDRGAAIMCTALLENALQKAILSINDLKKFASWFEGPNATFGTFAAKIQLGRVLSIYGDEMYGRLNLIKDIRNTFSHRALPLSFADPVVEESCSKLLQFVAVSRRKRNNRLIFVTTCIGEARKLEGFAFEMSDKKIRTRYR